MTTTKAECPTRQQWYVLVMLRNGPAKRIYTRSSTRGGNLRTTMSVQKRKWIVYDHDANHYMLSDAGKAALVAGDRRYQASEIAYARRAL